MATDRTEDESKARNAAQFATTHWSLVQAAAERNYADGRKAMQQLCQRYWFPLYAFLRRSGYSSHDAQDLTHINAKPIRSLLSFRATRSHAQRLVLPRERRVQGADRRAVHARERRVPR